MQALKLQRKYPQVTQEDMFSLINKFNELDTEDTGAITKANAISALQNSGEGSYDQVREVLKHVSIDASGKVELEDWVELVTKLRSARASAILPTKAGKVTVQGSNANVSHTINEDERSEFTIHINGVLAGDPDVGSRLPIPTNNMQLFDECRDGLILCKLINDSVPETIDTRVLNVPKTKKGLNAFQITENNNIVITSAKAIGCSVVNIGSSDIAEGREHLILGLIWQIIRRGLLSKIDLKNHPELYRLLEEGETVEDLLRLPPDQLLLRWFNYHLKAAGHKRRVNNFSRDVMDGENYTILLNQLKPAECSRAPLQERDPLKRAEMVLQNADKIGCRKYLSAQAMVAGNPKLNLAFTAHLFNTHPGLAPLEEPMPTEAIEDFDAEGEREARVFTLWLNSLNVEPSVYSLFDDLKDGVVILQAFDKVNPGSVIWRRVSKPKPLPTSPVQATFTTGDDEDEGPVPHAGLSRFKAVENNNYAVELAKANGMHIVGIQGSDIVDGTKTLVLGLVWQLMRLSIYKTLSSLTKSGRPPTDQDILRWANNTVLGRNGGTPNSPPLRSFKDPALSSAVFFLDLLDALRSGIVDYSLVYNPARTDEEKKQNAKLAISIARKMNALIFLVPEDIVDIRPRLLDVVDDEIIKVESGGTCIKRGIVDIDFN
ncbi:Fimbrin [Ceratobasidium theobromae]|uniref:Fimbrin n=1 Tax=Ceratobasidium theobromae TaxID=1582974 RepID=A0A5N5QJF9_9AGAM|nr:Fimbrin [Ceratobasidium theobromae]